MPVHPAPDPPQPGLPEPRNDPTADAILEATLSVIAARGLKGATTRAIAEAAGVNEVTLFRRYGNKLALIRAAIQRRSGAVRQSAVQYSGDLEADLIHLTREYQKALQSVGPVIHVMVTEFPRHPELRGVLDGPRQLFGAIAALLTRYQQEGKLRPEPVTTLLPAFLGPLVLPHLVPDLGPLLMQTPLSATDPEAHVRGFLHGRATLPVHTEDPA